MSRRGRPVLGGISGILLGAFVALDLQQFAIRALDSLTVIGLPVVGLVVGVVAGLVHPLRRGSRPQGGQAEG